MLTRHAVRAVSTTCPTPPLAQEKIAQLDARQERRASEAYLKVASFDRIEARTAVSPDHESTPEA
ncbi:hypothetical protein [Streptomyces sp. NPDC048650]|uniref:hypothetical protein n=1 Tax=unclassified Streptomyces TaxID=2593676 RepID=UPI00371EF234